DVAARHQIVERQHPPADAVARFQDGDVGAGVRELVGGRETGEPAADDGDARPGGAEHGRQAIAEEDAGGRGHHLLQHLAAGHAGVGGAMAGAETGVKASHGEALYDAPAPASPGDSMRLRTFAAAAAACTLAAAV